MHILQLSVNHILTNMLLKNPSNSMEKSLSRITLIFQLTGIQYFCISTGSLEAAEGQSLTRKQKLLFIANIAIVIGEFSGIVFAIFLEESLHKQHGNVVAGQIVQFTSYYLATFVLLITMLNSLFLRGKARQIYKNCRNISEILSTLNQRVDYATLEYEFKKTFAKLSLCFIGSTVATVIFIYQHNQTNVFLWAVLVV